MSQKPFYVLSDRGRIQQILINLLSNALKFSPKNSIVVVSLKTIFADIPGHLPHYLADDDSEQSTYQTWQLSVRDFGIGMNTKDQENLFKPFFKSTDRTSCEMNKQGNGLGLSIVAKIAKFLGGHMLC